jgi:hypothetical protein
VEGDHGADDFGSSIPGHSAPNDGGEIAKAGQGKHRRPAKGRSTASINFSSILMRSWSDLSIVPHDHGRRNDGRRHDAMHLLLILILLCLIFPVFARSLGGCLSIVLWVVFAIVVLAVFGAMSD